MIFYSINQKMKTNLYISSLDTPLSYHIAQYFREDHYEIDPSIRIVGSSSQPIQLPWIHASIDFQKYPQLACRTVLDCDIVILDLRSQSHEAETIIRFLKKVSAELKKSMRVIGISSLLTWEGTKAYELQAQTEDRQSMMASIVDQNKWRPIQLKDRDYPKRVPNVLANRTYQLENMVLSLNEGKIKASILGIGLMYGKESEAIQSQILRGISSQTLNIWGDGNNLLPLVYIQSFLKSLRLLIGCEVEYAVIRDEKVFTQEEVKQMILRATGSKSQVTKRQPLFVTEQEALWSLHQNITCSQMFRAVSEQKNFESYCKNEMMADICEYTEWTPCQSVLLSDQFDPQVLQAIKAEVSGILEIISEEEIMKLSQQLMLKSISLYIDQLQAQKQKPGRKISRQQLIQQQLQSMQPRYIQAIQLLLTNRKYLNFLVIASQKTKQFISHSLFLKGLAFIVQRQHQNHARKQIVYNSDSWYQFMGLEAKQRSQQLCESHLANEPAKEAYDYREGKIKKDERLILTTQYLLDNVLGAISQAKFSLRAQKKTGLNSFISELKAIYIRGNYQPYVEEKDLNGSKAAPIMIS